MEKNGGTLLDGAVGKLKEADQELQSVIGLQVVGRPLTPEEQAAIKAG
jgi:hypothetical protein